MLNGSHNGKINDPKNHIFSLRCIDMNVYFFLSRHSFAYFHLNGAFSIWFKRQYLLNSLFLYQLWWQMRTNQKKIDSIFRRKLLIYIRFSEMNNLVYRFKGMHNKMITIQINGIWFENRPTATTMTTAIITKKQKLNAIPNATKNSDIFASYFNLTVHILTVWHFVPLNVPLTVDTMNSKHLLIHLALKQIKGCFQIYIQYYSIHLCETKLPFVCLHM